MTGPSNTGKTRLTARALTVWGAEHGTDGVVVLDFAPELHQNDRLLGGFLTRFTNMPDGIWYGRVDADAPRAVGATETESLEFAAANARQSKQLVETAPADPRAVFVNDATIPFQASVFDPTVFFTYCDTAAGVGLNAFESDEIGVDDAISRNEHGH